jgi:hypothetical protein
MKNENVGVAMRSRSVLMSSMRSFLASAAVGAVILTALAEGLATTTAGHGQEGRCGDVYIAESSIAGAGRGVFAGRTFLVNEVVIDANFIVMPSGLSHLGTQLENYIFETGFEDHDMLALSYASILNHAEDPNVEHYWNDEDLLNEGEGLNPVDDHISSNVSVQFVAARTIYAGEEIRTSYGDVEWFTARFGDQFRLMNESSKSQGQSIHNTSRRCMDHVVIKNSGIALAGKGLFAVGPISAGETIIVDPVLAISMEEWNDLDAKSVLRNYIIWDSISLVGFTPIGYVWAVNHAHGRHSNAHLEWHNPPAASNKTLEDILSAPYTPLEISLVADRTIGAWEEILIDYGDDWTQSWTQYLSRRVLRYEGNYDPTCSFSYNNEAMKAANNCDSSQFPVFRHHIQAEGISFSDNWK